MRWLRIEVVFLGLMVLMAVAAPWLYTIDPNAMDPSNAHLPPATRAEFVALSGDTFTRLFPLGTDSMGRDLWSRTVYGARASLAVACAVAGLSMLFGIAIGLCAGFFRRLDGLIMRAMDGIMAIPPMLFALGLVAACGPSLATVIFAIVLPETPHVVRLVRSLVLSLREEPYIEASIALDTPVWQLMVKHILPNAMGPLLVQAAFIFSVAMLLEAAMSFLGVGLPSNMPSWGSIMSEGRLHFTEHPFTIVAPGLSLSLTLIAMNVLGDRLRDALDPKFDTRGLRNGK
jgi:peptide/nickel transport system permease protein